MEISQISYPINAHSSYYPSLTCRLNRIVSHQLCPHRYRPRFNHRTKNEETNQTEKKKFVSTHRARFERNPLESLSRSMHHALPPSSPMNQFENSPVQSDRARSSGHTPALYPIGSTISIGNISGKAKEPASVYFDKTVRPWTITTKEARSFKTTMPRGLIYSWQRRGGMLSRSIRLSWKFLIKWWILNEKTVYYYLSILDPRKFF